MQRRVLISEVSSLAWGQVLGLETFNIVICSFSRNLAKFKSAKIQVLNDETWNLANRYIGSLGPKLVGWPQARLLGVLNNTVS